ARDDGLVDGRRLLLVSWYHDLDTPPVKGVRLSLADITNLNAVPYRHLLLVEPKETAGGVGFEAAEYDSGGSLHAGGIVWYGDYLYVADTSQGLRVYDLSRMLRPLPGNDQDLLGISAG